MSHRPTGTRALCFLVSCLAFVAGSACGGGSAGTGASDPSTAGASAPADPYQYADRGTARQGLASIFVVHLMSDYEGFKKYFEEGAADRAKGGVKGYLMTKLDDERVVIHLFAEDVETVQRALKSPDMEKFLDRKGAPETSLLWLTRDVVVWFASTPPSGDTYSLYLKVKVADIEAFRKAFEERRAVFTEHGVIAEGLHQSTENGEIAILHLVGTSKEKLTELPKRKEFGELLALTKDPADAKPLVGKDVARSRPAE